MVLEAVTNAHKHAQAGSVVIDVFYSVPWLWVTVADDGQGGAVEKPGGGLAGLRDRVVALDGSFLVKSSGKGTTISARIPAFPV